MQSSDDLQVIMQRMLADNAAAAKNVVSVALTEREAAAADRAAAGQALQDAQQQSKRLAAAFRKKHLSRVEADLREQLERQYAERLLRNGLSPSEVAALLDMPDQQITDIAQRVGYRFVPIPGTSDMLSARVGYENHGRGGYMTLYWGAHHHRFWFEIAATPALLLIEVPTEAQWEAQTGIPLQQRSQVLQFLGERLVADEMPDHWFRIEPDSVVIY